MGVGVYHSDFDGRGSTFIVDGPLDDDQDGYDDANLDMIVAVEAAAKAAGFDVEKRMGFRADAAAFDREFVAIADDGVVAVAWRSWVTDFIVGVGPTRRAGERLDWDAEYLLVETGRGRQAYDDQYADHVALAAEYFRLSLMNEGTECRFRTSGYTTGAYATPDNIEARISELRLELDKSRKIFELSRGDALIAASAKERAEIINTAKESRLYSIGGKARYDAAVEIPFVDKKRGSVKCYCPQMDADDPDTSGIVAEMTIPEGIRDFVLSLPGDDAAAIPRTPETAAWFASRQTRHPASGAIVFVSASEFAEATGEEVAVALPDLDGDTDRTAVLAEAPSPAPSPAS